jgi:hypothetical protein
VSDERARELGVIECFHAVLNQCPSGAVRLVAENALAAVEREGAKALPEQAFRVLSATRGWHGARADQVKRSLESFLSRAGD